MKPEQERLRTVLIDTVTLLCKNGLHYGHELRVQGLIGVTMDDVEVFIVHINESYEAGGSSIGGGGGGTGIKMPLSLGVGGGGGGRGVPQSPGLGGPPRSPAVGQGRGGGGGGGGQPQASSTSMALVPYTAGPPRPQMKPGSGIKRTPLGRKLRGGLGSSLSPAAKKAKMQLNFSGAGGTEGRGGFSPRGISIRGSRGGGLLRGGLMSSPRGGANAAPRGGGQSQAGFPSSRGAAGFSPRGRCAPIGRGKSPRGGGGRGGGMDGMNSPRSTGPSFTSPSQPSRPTPMSPQASRGQTAPTTPRQNPGMPRHPNTPQHQMPGTPQHQMPGTPQHQMPGTPQHQMPGTPQHQMPGTPHQFLGSPQQRGPPQMKPAPSQQFVGQNPAGGGQGAFGQGDYSNSHSSYNIDSNNRVGGARDPPTMKRFKTEKPDASDVIDLDDDATLPGDDISQFVTTGEVSVADSSVIPPGMVQQTQITRLTITRDAQGQPVHQYEQVHSATSAMPNSGGGPSNLASIKTESLSSGGMMNVGATGGMSYDAGVEDENYPPDLIDPSNQYANAEYSSDPLTNQNASSYGYQGYDEMDYLADFKMGGDGAAAQAGMSTWGNLGQGQQGSTSMPTLQAQWMGDGNPQQMKMEYAGQQYQAGGMPSMGEKQQQRQPQPGSRGGGGVTRTPRGSRPRGGGGAGARRQNAEAFSEVKGRGGATAGETWKMVARFVCSIPGCDQSFSNKSNLLRHQNVKHGRDGKVVGGSSEGAGGEDEEDFEDEDM